MSSPTKQLRDATASDEPGTVAVKSARTNGTSDDSAAQQLAQALRSGFGLFSYLSIHDAVAVLHCCKAFWEDTELAARALQLSPAREFAQHFGTKCYFDWFCLDPRRCPTGYSDEMSGCDHVKSLANEATDRASGRLDNVVEAHAAPTIDARLVAVVAAVEAFILPAHPAYRQYVTSWGDPVFATPVVIPLRSYHPDGANLPYFHDWSREDVRVALNALRPSFGDRFVDDDPAHAYATDFGLHWDNTSLSSETGDAECAFCGVAQYINAHAAAKEMDERNYREHRSEDGNENEIERPIGSRMRALQASALGVKYAHCEAAFLVPDPSISDVAKAVGLVVFPGKGEEGYKHDYYGDGSGGANTVEVSIDEACDPQYGFPQVCAAVVRPLKQFLLQRCKFTRRMKYVWYTDEEGCVGYLDSEAIVQLCAGVTPSGYLCGTYFVRGLTQ